MSIPDWETLDFEDIFRISGGGQPPKSQFTYQQKPGYIRLLQIRDFENDDKPAYIPTGKASKRCVESDIMMGRYGASIGNVFTGKAGAYNVALVKVIINDRKITREFAIHWLKSPAFQRPMTEICYRSAQAGFGKSDLASIPIILPPIAEQKSIAHMIDRWDLAIQCIKRLGEASQLRRKGLMQQLLTGKRRFPGFSGPWLTLSFSDLFERSINKNVGGLIRDVVSMTVNGAVPQSEYFNKDVTSEDQSVYLIADHGDLVMSGLNFWMGAIDFQHIFPKAIVSPAYKVFKIRGDMEPEYLRCFVRSESMRTALLNASVQGASIVRRNLDMDMLMETEFQIPPPDEQRKILGVLRLLNREASLYESLRISLENQKVWLMQQLLTGKRRVKTLAA